MTAEGERARAPASSTNALRSAPAADVAPPVAPNLVRPREIPGARHVGRNTLEILVFRGLSTPLALVLVVLQSRFLEPSGRGAYVLAVLTVTIFSRLLGQLGVAAANRLREEAGETRELVQRALALGALTGAAAIPLIALFGAYAADIGTDVALLAALALIPNVIWQTISGVLLGLARIRLWNYIQLGSPLLTTVGLVALVVWLDAGVRGAVLAWTVANVVTAALALVATRDLWLPLRLPRLGDRTGRMLARLAVTMGAVQVVNLVSYRIELFVLDRYRGLDDVGIYSIAMQAAEAMWLIAAAVANAVIAPAVHESDRGAARIVGRGSVRALLITAGVGALVALLAPFAIPAIFGEAFDGASRPLLLLLPGVVLYAPVSVLVVYLSVRRGRPELSLMVALAGMALTLGAAIVLIPDHGSAGAAVASTIGYAAGALLAWFFFVRLSRTHEHDPGHYERGPG
ncbi:MAG: oligosaccharide flippase family protein [Actinomycetota bacterium]|nr:oligosaccharide flippase family protein [Actinomycetota bacterium]